MFDDCEDFCACAFLDKIYLIEGYFSKNIQTTNSCLKLNAREKTFSNRSWNEIAKMKEQEILQLL